MNYFDKTNTSHFLLNPIRSFIEDPDVSEILINKPQEIWVEKYGDLKPYTVNEMDLSRMRRVFRLLSAENKQEPSIGKDNPMLSGSLLDGSRVQLVHPPVAGHFTLSIRRKTVLNRTLEDYSNDNYYQHMEYADIDDNFISEQDQHLLKLYNAKDWDSFIYYALKYKKILSYQVLPLQVKQHILML